VIYYLLPMIALFSFMGGWWLCLKRENVRAETFKKFYKDQFPLVVNFGPGDPVPH